MPNTLSPQDWLALDQKPVLLDVRSPGEFSAGHWPGAVNLPLFSNDERAEVGTLYKQSSPDSAFLRGLELAGKKMRWYIEEARRLAPAGSLVLHCWRGGQRSQSMAWLLSKAMKEVRVIEGGYKALRHVGRKWLGDLPGNVFVLSGPTGSGKTKILQALRELEGGVIDLEETARHKGSSFGALGEKAQPTTEQFENELFCQFAEFYKSGNTVWLENESKSIGRVYLPDELWRKMLKAPLVQLSVPQELRIENLVSDYSRYDTQDLIQAFERIGRRLGGQHLKTALEALAQKDFTTAARIALRYYDKAYHMSLQKNGQQAALTMEVKTNDPMAIAKTLLAWQKQREQA